MNNPKVKQVVLPLITAFIWGSAFVAQSLSTGFLGCCTFNAARSVAAALALGVLLFVLGRIRPREKYTRAQKMKLLRGGLVCGLFLTLGSNLQQFGLEETSAGKAGFITALYIVLVPLLSIFFGKRASAKLWLCVAITVGGLYFLCFDGSSAIAFTGGDFYIFLCAFAFAAQIMAVDHYVSEVDGVMLSCAQFIVMAILSAIGAAILGEPVSVAAIGECVPYILYVGIFSGGIAYTLQILAQKDGDPTVVSLLLSLESFFAVVCGAIILHERMSGREYLGCALMLIAVVLSQLPEKKKAQQE